MIKKQGTDAGKTIMLILILATVISIFQFSRMGLLTNNDNVDNSTTGSIAVEKNPLVTQNTHSINKVAVIYDDNQKTREAILNNFCDLFDTYSIDYDVFTESDSLPDYNYSLIVCLFGDYENLPVLQSVLDQVEDGARAYFPMVPVDSDSYVSVSSSFGIIEKSYVSGGTKIIDCKGMFGAVNKEYQFSEPIDLVYRVRLRDDCDVYFKDNNNNPLLWKRLLGSGYMYISNCDDLSKFISRGVISQILYETLKQPYSKAFIYPSYSVSTQLVSDFPSPYKPTQSRILDSLGTNYDDFVSNEFWPFVMQLDSQYSIKPTISYVDSYDENTEGDFKSYLSDSQLKTYATDAVSKGGEIAFHGYSMRPLGLKGELLDLGWFIPWQSLDAIGHSLNVASSDIKTVYPNYSLKTYIPPQGRISDNVLKNLKDMCPSIEYVVSPYTQMYADQINEFFKSEYGITTLPLTGNETNLDWSTANSLASLGVFSSEININRSLDDSNISYDFFTKEIKESYKSASMFPGMHSLTLSELGERVRAYDDVSYSYIESNDKINIEIDNYFDGVSFIVRSDSVLTDSKDCTVSTYLNNCYVIYPHKKSVSIEKAVG